MKYGAVCTPGLRADPSDVGRQADLLRRLKATTARISMYFDSPGFARRYTDGDLDRLRAAGLSEMIIQSSENPTPDQAFDQLEAVRGYIRQHPDILFVFELGNEPDIFGDEVGQPALARARRLTYLRDR